MIGVMIFTRLIFSRAALVSAIRLVGLGLRRFIPWLIGGAVRLFGFLLLAAATWLIERGITELWGTVQDGAYTLAYFDWNQSDETIRQQIRANNQQIAQLVGRFAGSGLVRIAAVGAAYGLKLQYPVVAGRIALDLAEDTSGQLRGEFTSMITGVRQITTENAILTMILTFRQRRWFGQEPRTQDGPYSSFASEIERRVEAIPNPLLRNFVMGFLEGAEDAFWDVGYIISGTLDDVVAANRFRNQSELGPERAVLLTPDSRAEETVLISGPQQQVQQTITQTIAHHQLIHNRDVGQIVGLPFEDYPRARLQTRILVVCFKSKAEPPWHTAEGRSKEISYSIPDVKRGLSWAEIKAAAPRFTWGPFRATAVLDNNRQMAIYGVSPAEAESQLRSLLRLSSADLMTLTISEEKIRNPAHIKRPTLMYPCYATLVSTPTDFQGRPLGGDRALQRERRRITLWTEQEPDNLGPLG